MLFAYSVKYAVWYLHSWNDYKSDYLMFKLNIELIKNLAVLITVSSAVTAVGVQIAVYEERQAELKNSVKDLQEKVAYLDSIARSRGQMDDIHTSELERLRSEINELRN